MDFVTPIITPIVESLLVPIKKHLGFWVSSTKHVKNMGERMEQLNDTVKDVEKKKETADVSNQVVSEHVRRWLEDVNKMNEEAKSIPTAKIGCFNVATRYRAGKRSCDVLKKIEDLKTRESEIKWTNQKKALAKVASTSTGPSTSTPVHDGDVTQVMFESRDLIFKAALKSLIQVDETHKMIALCGMGGVGKTTMMEQLKEVVEKSKMFDWVVKVVLGEDTNPIAIQQDIAEKLGEALSETSLDARAERLGKMFEGTSQDGKKKILVIMDDLWKEVELKDFGLRRPFPRGLKLLFTSRFENICTQMGVKAGSIFKVSLLNDAEAETLFFKNVEEDGYDPQLKKIGEYIVKKCGGLPIAIVTIAKSLRANEKDAWEEALSNLQHHDLQDLDRIRDRIFEMSYNNLKKEDEKAIFLLSGLFPDDFDIPIEDLMRYGWGLKLFGNVPTLADARRRTNTCVNKLKRANLLMQSDRGGCVRMHDLMRDFVLTNFTKVKQASIVNHENMQCTLDAGVSYGRILLSCKGMSQFPAEFSHPKLSLLMLMDGNKELEFPKDFYDRMKKLEVMSFERMYTPLLRVRFEFSTELQTLCLRSCALTDDFSFLESLENLETLSFADCQIRNLPSRIGKLKKLKLLDVTGCSDLSIDDGVLENMVSLKELYMKALEYKVIRFTHANCEELKILSQRLSALELEFFENKAEPKNVSFKQLERFRISIGCQLDRPEDYSFKNTLTLKADSDELRECKISELFEKTEELRLQVNDMTGIEDLSLTDLPEHPFCNLRNLIVSKCSNLRYLFTIPVANGLKKLECLTISECRKLVSLCDIEIANDEIELPQMVELILDGLPKLCNIYPDNNNASSMQSFLNKVSVPRLRKIRVSSCESLENIFPRNPLLLLSNLQELEVKECDSIEVLFNIDLECVSEMEEESLISSLREIKVDGLGKLRELWRIEGDINNYSNILINSFKGVERIEIRNSKRFTYMFTPTTTNFDLGALTTYFSDGKLGGSSHEISEELMDENNVPSVTYTSHLVRTCHNLQSLELWNDPRVEVVFEMDDTPSPSGRSKLAIIGDTQQLLLFPAHQQLKILDLYSLEEMSHVWKCNNWNNFSIPPHHQLLELEFPFHNLTNVRLGSCHKIKYLFSPLMVKFLSSLKEVRIYDCDVMEEVISRRDDEMCATSSHATNTPNYFPHLDHLYLHNLPCLYNIDGHTQCGTGDEVVMGASNWSLCQFPKKIELHYCEALSSVLIPWYAVGQMKRLERLTISYCTSIIEVFESSESSMKKKMSSCSSSNYVSTTSTIREHDGSTIYANGDGGGTLTSSPPLINILSTLHVPQLSNLQEMIISDCDLLGHVFTFSTLQTLNQLKTLSVSYCKALTQVVIVKQQELKEDEEEEEEVNGNMASSLKGGVVLVEFRRLETLVLEDLPKLEGFFLGNINIHFRWPLLEDVKIINCPEMSVFTSGHSETPKLKYIHTDLGKYIVEGKYSGGLNFQRSGSGTTNQQQDDDDQTTSFSSSDPTTISKGMPWRSFYSLIEILKETDFKVETIIPSNVLSQLQKLEKIYLRVCDKVKEVFEVGSLKGTNIESQIIVKIPNLREVELAYLWSLEYIWKSNQWMVLEFPNLTTVSIEHCPKLEHIFTCSMASSLVQLQHLSISYCEKINVIIKEDEKEGGDDIDKVNDIVLLPRLKSIKLEELSSLKGFCLGDEAFSLPLLDTLEIKKCPMIFVFTKGHLDTPELKVIDTGGLGIFCVRNNLNLFIRTEEEEIFGSNGVTWNLSLSPWLFEEEKRD